MKRRPVHLQISDHAVLRYLERAHGLDVALVREHLAGLAINAAELGAVSVKVEDVHLVLREDRNARPGAAFVTLATVIPVEADDFALFESFRRG